MPGLGESDEAGMEHSGWHFFRVGRRTPQDIENDIVVVALKRAFVWDRVYSNRIYLLSKSACGADLERRRDARCTNEG